MFTNGKKEMTRKKKREKLEWNGIISARFNEKKKWKIATKIWIRNTDLLKIERNLGKRRIEKEKKYGKWK